MIHALVECLSGPATRLHGAGKQRANMMVRFEAECIAHAQTKISLFELCVALDVAERSLRTCCRQYLGMGPMRYLCVRRMKLVRHALRTAHPTESKVADLAARYGFTSMTRFTAVYRRMFGELPAATLQRRDTCLTMRMVRLRRRLSDPHLNEVA